MDSPGADVARTRIEPRTLRGFSDTMPDVAARQQRIVRVIQDEFARFGYEPFHTPALEYAEILRGKGGDESDKQIFEFADQGSRQVALRFDLTVPLARFVAQHSASLAMPFRGYNIGYVWRGERPQRGRLREFLQCDADIVGDTDVVADAEILAMFSRVLGAIGVGEVVLRVNDRRVLDGFLKDLGLTDRSLLVLRALDKVDKVGRDVSRGEMVAGGIDGDVADRLLDFSALGGGSNGETMDAMRAALPAGGAASTGLAALADLLAAVEATGTEMSRIRLDPSIARGLDYYTGMVYETTLVAAPEIGSVSSGGRYDNLTRLFGAQALPGVGGSIGVSRILAAVDASAGPPSVPLVVITRAEADDPATLGRLAETLRADGGCNVSVYPRLAKHSAQMKYADVKGAAWVLTLEADERVSIKDLRTGSRETAELSQTAEAIRRLAGGTPAP